VYIVDTAHNPEVAGSNPAPATGKAPETGPFRLIEHRRAHNGCCPDVARSSRRGVADVGHRRRPLGDWLTGGRGRDADATSASGESTLAHLWQLSPQGGWL